MSALNATDHRRVARFVEAVAGIRLPAHKRDLVTSRLRRRLEATGHDNVKSYLDFALADEQRNAEQLELVDALTTNRTDFFREGRHFEFLAEWVRSGRGQGVPASRSPLRVWSAGCATGEEPYTLAMVLLELQAVLPGFDFELWGSDISRSSLERARAGIYPQARVEPVPTALRRRYLLRSRDREAQLVRVGPSVRERVRFFPFNLIRDDYPDPGSLDVIFCRNVMIYFGEQSRGHILDNFHRCLCPGGLLFLGHSESIGNLQTGFESVAPTIHRRRADRP
ncbi:MAG: CheR family methyltransferase [Halothiobacillaceae bacterium]